MKQLLKTDNGQTTDEGLGRPFLGVGVGVEQNLTKLTTNINLPTPYPLLPNVSAGRRTHTDYNSSLYANKEEVQKIAVNVIQKQH